MQIRLLAIPFHWVYPSAPAKYLGTTVSIPVYDPEAYDRDAKTINAARVASFNAAVGSVDGKPYRGAKLPEKVYIPVDRLMITRVDVGRGREFKDIALEHRGFRQFLVDDLARLPFALCPSQGISRFLRRKFRRMREA